MKDKTEAWMAEALSEARKGLGFTAPNPPVGAVMVKGQKIIASGYHAKAGKPHAEAMAIKAAGTKASGATLVVTLEPCSTTGRTPPCTQAILDAKIRRVVVGCVDPNPAHAGKGLELLRQAGVEVEVGVLEQDCQELIRPFAHLQKTGFPFVTLKLGCSLDGRIADKAGTSQWITGPESRERVQEIRRKVDAVLVGTETVKQDNPSLMPRPAYGHAPLRIIPDRKGRVPLTAKVFTDSHAHRTLVLIGPEVSEARVKRLESKGVQTLRVPVRQGRIDWKRTLKLLGKRGVMHLLCEGGGHLSASLLRHSLVQEIHWITAPLLLGETGRPAVADGFSLAKAPSFTLHNVERVGQDVWMTLQPEA